MSARSISFLLFFIICFLFFVPQIFAKTLPQVEITSEQWKTPAEQVLAELQEKRGTISYKQFKQQRTFWNYVLNLKTDLLSLQPEKNPALSAEADLLAKRAIARLYQLSQEYRVVGWPYLQNMLIKMKVKERGYCYHYTEDLLKDLSQTKWKFFDLYWGEAAADTWHESNALVITAWQKPFASGLALDGWRKGGRPFWILVAKDKRWKWQEFDYQNKRPLYRVEAH